MKLSREKRPEALTMPGQSEVRRSTPVFIRLLVALEDRSRENIHDENNGLGNLD